MGNRRITQKRKRNVIRPVSDNERFVDQLCSIAKVAVVKGVFCGTNGKILAILNILSTGNPPTIVGIFGIMNVIPRNVCIMPTMNKFVWKFHPKLYTLFA